MTTVTNWISPETMQSLGWALLHFLWQGTALAALAAAAMAVFRKPAARYLIGIIVLGLMLVGPVGDIRLLLAATFEYHRSSRSRQPLAAADWPIARGNTAASGSTPTLPDSISRRSSMAG